MNYVYPAVFHPEIEGGYSVYFPDVKRGATQGDTVAECIKMAEDFLCLALYDLEEEKLDIPPVSALKNLSDDENDIVTLIAVDTDIYRRYYENKMIKKTLNIPMWLNQRAADANINFSQTLQRALKEELGVE